MFEDNFDKPPVQLRIISNRNPGALFPWGRYQVLYTASDRAGNKATCEFYVEVGRKLIEFIMRSLQEGIGWYLPLPSRVLSRNFSFWGEVPSG